MAVWLQARRLEDLNACILRLLGEGNPLAAQRGVPCGEIGEGGATGEARPADTNHLDDTRVLELLEHAWLLEAKRGH